MALIWEGISDNTGTIKVWTAFHIDGAISRSNNTVWFNDMYVRNYTPTAGAYNNARWYADIYNNALTEAYIPGWQSKPLTGSAVITNNQYYTSHTTPAVTVGAYDTVFYFAHRINTDGVWRGWIAPIGVAIPATSNPSLSSTSVTSIKPTQATLNWAAYAGDYCTWSSMTLQYGLTTGYGSGNGIAASGSQTLTGLKPGKTYHYRFYMVNAAGRAAYSGDYTFKTKGIAGHTPLLIGLT